MLVDDIPLEQFAAAALKVYNKTDFEYELFHSRKTGRLAMLMQRVARDGTDVSHWTGRYIRRNTAQGKMKGSLGVCSGRVKEYLVHEGVFEEKCAICELPPLWQGQHLALHLDHIDGDKNNHTTANLRLLCPNCHQQTETWGNKRHSKLPNDGKMLEHLHAGLRYDEIASLYDVTGSTVSHRLRRLMFKHHVSCLRDLLSLKT